MNPFIDFLDRHLALGEAEVAELELRLERRCYRAGEKILHQGSVCRHIAYMVSGKARAYFLDHDGQEFTWSFHFNDEDARFENQFLLDYQSFLSRTPTFLTIEAIDDVELIQLAYEDQQHLMAAFPKIAALNGRMTEIAYQAAHRRAFSLLTMNARERYMQLLSEEPHMLQKFKHYLIASFLGIAPQSLSRLRNGISRV